jgi:hypothetical protein
MTNHEQAKKSLQRAKIGIYTSPIILICGCLIAYSRGSIMGLPLFVIVLGLIRLGASIFFYSKVKKEVEESKED